jgi:hypothetical protein
MKEVQKGNDILVLHITHRIRKKISQCCRLEVNWIELAQGEVQWRALMPVVLKLRVYYDHYILIN